MYAKHKIIDGTASPGNPGSPVTVQGMWQIMKGGHGQVDVAAALQHGADNCVKAKTYIIMQLVPAEAGRSQG